MVFDKSISSEIIVPNNIGSVVGVNKGIIDNHFYPSEIEKPHIYKLIQRLKQQIENDHKIQQISEELNNYFINLDEETPADLEMKLKLANKENEYKNAIRLKEEFCKIITKFSSYEAANEYFTLLLSMIVANFQHLIYPCIRKGADEEEIMAKFHEHIIVKTFDEVQKADNLCKLNYDQIRGMVYFLIGNCYLWLDKGNI